MAKHVLTFMQKISLKAGQVSLYTEVLRLKPNTNELILNRKYSPKIIDSTGKVLRKATVEKAYHNFVISKNARQKIREKVSWLFTLSKAKRVVTYNGKEIFNFKVGFLTLTLPSSQMHSTAQITNECFNHFLTEIRERTKMTNYVWRLEFQKNHNVHYHLVTDTYIDYFFALKIWNRIINKLGYVDAYTKKFSAMSLSQYVASQGGTAQTPFHVHAKRYAKGKACNWSIAPCVDVISCSSDKAISYYISKYFYKNNDTGSIANALDNPENSFALRLWFCSRSLSRCKSITRYVEEAVVNWYDLLKIEAKAFVKHFDYASCIYFSISEMSNFCKSILYQEYKRYKLEIGYNSA